MFTTKSFIKKNKIGNFLKNVREHYIRDDISCGIPECPKCPAESSSYLSVSHVNKCTLFNGNHFIILDTNIVLDQMDVLEEPVIANVIILHTVFNEVKHRSLPIYKRLNAILENPSRHFYVFINDHHKDCYLPEEEGELINDHNDRCIRKATSWYINHLPDKKFVLITDDNKNKQLALSEGIPTCTITEYVQNLENSSVLEDKLSRKDYHTNDDSKDLFPAHLSTGQLLKAIKEGTLHQGTFRASRDNFLEGFVNIESFKDPVLLQGRSGLNRAVDGDIVAVEIFEQDNWVSPSEIVLEDDSTVDDLEEKEKGLKGTGEVQPTGRVVGIIRRKWKQYCGILQGGSEGLYQIFVPANRSIPKVRIETRQAEFLRTQKLIVTIDSWPRNSRYPHGHFVRALGRIGSQDTENEVVLLEHDVPHSQFSEDVLACLPQLPWVITEEDEKKRVDLRGIDICSVDPPGCTDIDDALHCRLIDDGTKLEVGVHIADVSHFIRPGTAIDLEASSRATTVYLVGKRIDMVPELLSSNLCSLRGGEERFAFSCIWEMDLEANILSTRFHKSIIKSRRAMTYEEAQITIDDQSKRDSIAESLRNLNELAKILKKRRLEKGALVLASTEVKILMDSETMEPLDVEVKKMYETNSMVEEFMLLANISVAEKILEDFPDCAMLRRHPTPPAANFDPLVKAARHLGYEILIDSGKNLAESLDKATSDKNPYLNTMLRMLATRCMLQAVYFPSGTLQKDDYFHYGLAVPLYTHFTSPIRRYADIIVHRLLAVSCGADSTYPDLLDKQKSADLCQNLNYRNRMAQYAGRASVAFNTHLFFKGKLNDEEGYILYVRKNALQILIPKYGLECTLYLVKKGETSIFEYDEERQTQRAGDVVFYTFDPVTIRLHLDSTNVQHEKFVVQLVKPVIEGFSVPPLEEAMEASDIVATPNEKRKKKEQSKKSKKSRK
ncbi:exosome complex exonuclease RRP44 [Anthonomus grandis grandis]|uniref:exosome complex exonuclease RRP44 n=1 Tax=Anthonomus grandis grandis TaxID=2921223 RepID=UPI0021664A2F|nr:exosome complex exonuclease RRP44 [Anthonomus grandis grandis]